MEKISRILPASHRFKSSSEQISATHARSGAPSFGRPSAQPSGGNSFSTPEPHADPHVEIAQRVSQGFFSKPATDNLPPVDIDGIRAKVFKEDESFSPPLSEAQGYDFVGEDEESQLVVGGHLDVMA